MRNLVTHMGDRLTATPGSESYRHHGPPPGLLRYPAFSVTEGSGLHDRWGKSSLGLTVAQSMPKMGHG
jgi:hypothetical protein